MTHGVWCFPDNTVLCNFAAVSRLRLLEKILDGRGRWTEAVAAEAANSARYLPELGILSDESWLGEPLVVDDPAELVLVDRLRRAVFGGRPNRPLQHLGEAETLVVIENREGYEGALWITDDGEAGRYARRRGIDVLDTVGLMRLAVADSLVPCDEAHGLLRGMQRAGRFLRGVPARPADLLPDR
ncbi:hypothetical protein HUT18_26335 [Streptomyces sp. NA04227]|uniref:hypothetical protein n=1 Tax=Streptomyces sp. NA04227 TaxID=2742136 RepID=UPI001590BF78|nr:hypothetical protein [Streptomyces sp. NA04227]QKW09382.1 hypothetical protein HUT18_26335 [Streptomyces sp. NA04227]